MIPENKNNLSVYWFHRKFPKRVFMRKCPKTNRYLLVECAKRLHISKRRSSNPRVVVGDTIRPQVQTSRQQKQAGKQARNKKSTEASGQASKQPRQQSKKQEGKEARKQARKAKR